MNDKKFRYICENIPNMKDLIEKIGLEYKAELELEKRCPNAVGLLGWPAIAFKFCPPYFKNQQGKWISFIKEFQGREKEYWEQQELLAASRIETVRPEKESVRSKVKKFVKKSFFRKKQLKLNFQ